MGGAGGGFGADYHQAPSLSGQKRGFPFSERGASPPGAPLDSRVCGLSVKFGNCILLVCHAPFFGALFSCCWFRALLRSCCYW